MARQHGADCRVYLGARDASGDLSEIEVKAAADTHDVTTFNSANWKENTAGLIGWEADVTGFYDPAAGGIGRQFEDLLGTGIGALSIYEGDADAIGDPGVLLGPGVLKERGQPINVADMVRLSGSIDGYGKAGLFGRLLHVHGADTVSTNSSSYDNTAQSTSGGRANLHVTAITGSWTIKIQESSDNGAGDAWADLVTFTQATAGGGITSESKEVTGTVERYLRVTSTEDVAGTISYCVGFARY